MGYLSVLPRSLATPSIGTCQVHLYIILEITPEPQLFSIQLRPNPILAISALLIPQMAHILYGSADVAPTYCFSMATSNGCSKNHFPGFEAAATATQEKQTRKSRLFSGNAGQAR
jgi:hypothetical protein